jgi:hypothetical protein
MASRTPRYDHSTNVDTRLSRLETIIDSIGSTLEKIQGKLDNTGKINWTPIGLGITIFMALIGSFSTIYTTRMNQADTNIKQLAEASQSLVLTSTEQRISVQTLKDRQDDMKISTEKNFEAVNMKLQRNSDRIRALEGLKPLKADPDNAN